MKKYLLVVLCALLVVVVGCSKKNQVKCSATQEEGGIKMEAEVIAEFDDKDIIKDATVVYDLQDEKTATTYCSLFKLAEDKDKGITVDCSGSKITISGFTKMEDENELDGKSKADFIKAMEAEKFTCK